MLVMPMRLTNDEHPPGRHHTWRFGHKEYRELSNMQFDGSKDEEETNNLVVV